MNDTVENLVRAALLAHCSKVTRLKFSGKANTYITYQLVIAVEKNFADDESQGTEYVYRADIYSKTDYVALVRRIKATFADCGFYGITIEPETYENDTGYYHVPIEIRYLEV